MSVLGIADSVLVSTGEISKSTRLLVASRLVVERSGSIYAEKGALLEWFSFGMRYMYPPVSAGYGRGVATSWSCPFIKSEILPPTPALVWALPGGNSEGELVQPFHASIPVAAENDDLLYIVLSLVDVIPAGKPRELAVARRLLKELIKGK